MVTFLKNDEITSVLDVPNCVSALYDGLKAYALGDATRRPRIDTIAPTSRSGEFVRFTTGEGVIREQYYALRVKPEIMRWPEIDGRRRLDTYYGRPGRYGGLVLLYRADDSELVSIMHDLRVQRMRTAAMAGLGARYLARQDSSVLGMLGTGRFARTFALALAAELPLKLIKAYSPSSDEVRTYCDEMSALLNIAVEPAASADAALSDADVICACTNSMVPVIHAHHVVPGLCICNVSNRELDQGARARITTIGHVAQKRIELDLSGFHDDNFAVRMNAMAYLAGRPEERAEIPEASDRDEPELTARHVACVDWETDKPLGRQNDDEVTLIADLAGGAAGHGLSSNSIAGIEIVSLAARAYELAMAKGLGTELPDHLFDQEAL